MNGKCRSGVSAWRSALKLSRHILFNLTRPEKSLLLLARLAEQAGGFGLCRDPRIVPPTSLPMSVIRII